MSKRSFSIGRRTLLVSGASAFVLSACSNIIGPPEAAPLYVLKPASPAVKNGPPAHWQLTVVLPESSDSLDTTRIMLLQPGGQMDYYANANWQDRLPFVVQGTLVEAFEASGRMPAVGRDTEGLKSDLSAGDGHPRFSGALRCSRYRTRRHGAHRGQGRRGAHANDRDVDRCPQRNSGRPEQRAERGRGLQPGTVGCAGADRRSRVECSSSVASCIN